VILLEEQYVKTVSKVYFNPIINEISNISEVFKVVQNFQTYFQSGEFSILVPILVAKYWCHHRIHNNQKAC
jgi:hypothetical protein